MVGDDVSQGPEFLIELQQRWVVRERWVRRKKISSFNCRNGLKEGRRERENFQVHGPELKLHGIEVASRGWLG